MKEKDQRTSRKVKEGIVIANKMDKTVVVSVSSTQRHDKYQKVITRSKKYYAHDDNNTCNVGDKVAIMETRPYSKTKCWRVVPTSK
ncbi:MAG: 30S ribosomal protein S17 [Waddliaceae bacterium]|nr:30S ribosomal protein S17 [Waddliaceae bacterium]MBT3578651.1 30S ribosomal protein S17 [Waddliaceae bacterium]MBT4445370.1 30S ribosomal protein S17 [Waddliaceae bacterium]MBT6928362.1 30S ribosomal protein S17 [Waddliaceae bacterium]MBT7265048.1 30S ribosomal protein S17 [Waddliaceae bacterium]